MALPVKRKNSIVLTMDDVIRDEYIVCVDDVGVIPVTRLDEDYRDYRYQLWRILKRHGNIVLACNVFDRSVSVFRVDDFLGRVKDETLPDRVARIRGRKDPPVSGLDIGIPLKQMLDIRY